MGAVSGSERAPAGELAPTDDSELGQEVGPADRGAARSGYSGRGRRVRARRRSDQLLPAVALAWPDLLAVRAWRGAGAAGAQISAGPGAGGNGVGTGAGGCRPGRSGLA